MMNREHVRVKLDTRNHQGFFVPQSEYKLVDTDQNGWAYICADSAHCYYVDPDSIVTDK
jgi:sugar phosphate isomerase/epimerase